jgi:DnaJ family protein A protein 2
MENRLSVSPGMAGQPDLDDLLAQMFGGMGGMGGMPGMGGMGPLPLQCPQMTFLTLENLTVLPLYRSSRLTS